MNMNVKADFPVFKSDPHLIYLDSGATSLKPLLVIEKIDEYYRQYPSNIHRGVYKIAERASLEYEKTREVIATFIGAKQNEIIFTKGTTESINLLAYSLEETVCEGDEIIVTKADHHANFVPWQQLAKRTNSNFRAIDIDAYYDLVDFDITDKTKIVALPYVSNVTGTIFPIKHICEKLKKQNPKVLIVVDAAQAIAHIKLDVSDIGCDFVCFSGHKMLGPTGVGVLWGKYEILSTMRPFQYGGDMISRVSVDQSTFQDPPYRFEAGTPPIAEVIALKEAVYYLQNIGFEKIKAYEDELSAYFLTQIDKNFNGEITLLGKKTVENRIASFSFIFSSFHPHDIAQILDEENIAIRAGHHCAMPLHTHFGMDATARASFYIYNTISDIDALMKALGNVKKILTY
jgi:cysteine desulfurase/selenocysteine lyase